MMASLEEVRRELREKFEKLKRENPGSSPELELG